MRRNLDSGWFHPIPTTYEIPLELATPSQWKGYQDQEYMSFSNL
jgi:hypothetical protein